LQGLTTEAPVRHPQPRSPLSRELSSPENELKKRGFSVEQRFGRIVPNVRRPALLPVSANPLPTRPAMSDLSVTLPTVRDPYHPQVGSSLLARMEPAIGGFGISRCRAACPQGVARATSRGKSRCRWLNFPWHHGG